MWPAPSSRYSRGLRAAETTAGAEGLGIPVAAGVCCVAAAAPFSESFCGSVVTWGAVAARTVVSGSGIGRVVGAVRVVGSGAGAGGSVVWAVCSGGGVARATEAGVAAGAGSTTGSATATGASTGTGTGTGTGKVSGKGVAAAAAGGSLTRAGIACAVGLDVGE